MLERPGATRYVGEARGHSMTTNTIKGIAEVEARLDFEAHVRQPLLCRFRRTDYPIPTTPLQCSVQGKLDYLVNREMDHKRM